MANEIINAEIRELRDIETVTGEIKELCSHAQHLLLIYAVEIGRRLVEAKEILPYGEWGDWLKNEVQFSQSTANKHMQIFKKFGSTQMSLFGAELKSETFTNLSYSQALKLLALPDDEVEEFVKENNISDMTTRELERVIRERDEALKQAEKATEYETAVAAAENKLRAAVEEGAKHQQTIDELTAKLNKQKEQNKKLKELVKNPEIPKEKVDELRDEIKTELDNARDEDIKKATADITAQLAAAEAEKAAAEAEAEKAQNEIDALRKQIVMSDPAVTEFKAQFNTAQDTLNKLVTVFGNISDTEIKQKFTAAVKAMFDKFLGEFGG